MFVKRLLSKKELGPSLLLAMQGMQLSSHLPTRLVSLGGLLGVGSLINNASWARTSAARDRSHSRKVFLSDCTLAISRSRAYA